MRQIIFRAKRIDNGEWVQGDLVRNAFNGSSKVMDFGIQRPNYFPHEVDPETVCQFTGLTDKNGVKIWENEWLYATVRSAVFHNYQGKVIFYNGSFLLHAIDPETGLFNNIDDAKPLSDYYELQVINNPELLNQ